MFNKFESIILKFSICLSVFAMNSCLNITEMNVPSVVFAPEKATLTCASQEQTENDTFVDIRWFKLVDNHWRLVKVFPQRQVPMGSPTHLERRADEGESEGGDTDTATSEEPPKEDPPKVSTEEPPKEDPPKDATEEPPKEEEATKEASEEPPKENTEAPPKEDPPTATESKPEDKTDAMTTLKPESLKKEPEYYTIIGMDQTHDSNIEFSQTSLSSGGLYKCVLKSSKEMTEQIKEMRVFYKPEEGTKPELSTPKINDNHISVKCKAPASYPMMAINFFINYDPAPHGEVHRLPAIRTKNTTYGSTDQLLMNVEELRFRATEHSVLNGKVLIACSATFANIEHSFAHYEFNFEGPLYHDKCLGAAFIILIIVAVLIVLIVIVAIVWLYLRKRKLNSLNKVAELFNKQKTITVLVDNNTNDLKVE